VLDKQIGDAIQVEELPVLSEDARALIWDVFFTSRERGVSLEYHFPWLSDKEQVTCLAIKGSLCGKEVVQAALVIKKYDVEAFGRVGLVGLVCVHEKCRGRGLSTLLIKHAIEKGRRDSLQALVLWTTKPDVYYRNGFSVDMVDYFGSVRKNTIDASINKTQVGNRYIYEKSRNDGGVPAFANEVVEFFTEQASITICNAKQTPSLVGWSGDTKKTVELIDQVLPSFWHINAAKDSPLIAALGECGYLLELSPGAARMVCMLNQLANQKIPYIEILNRI
jgi:GNAT superfamily N-acetyltransferase